MADVTQILHAVESGDRKAAAELLPLADDELRKPSDACDRPSAASFRTADGEDYAARTGSLTFASGETTKTVTIEVKGDGKETDEYFSLELFASSNSLSIMSRGTGIILNDA